MPSTELPPKITPEEIEQTPESAPRIPVGRYGNLDHHELIHLLDNLDDERARAQFRESIYISTIICLAIAWFLFYGPHIILHQPYYKDPIAVMKQQDRERLTYINPSPSPPPAPPKIDRKTMQQLQRDEVAKAAKQTPAPEAPTPEPEIAKTTPPVQQMPSLPTPAAPKPNEASPEAPLPAAPKPTIADNSQSPGQAMRDAMKGAMGRADLPSISGGAAGPLQAGAQILSDTQGVDFTAYMRRLRADLYRNWTPLIPEEVQPPILKKGIVGIRFSILPDGQIGDMKLETQSGDVALDKAAWYAITSEGQFPPLPREYHGPQLDLRIGFFYNRQPEQR